jgi:hypothetical protein
MIVADTDVSLVRKYPLSFTSVLSVHLNLLFWLY